MEDLVKELCAGLDMEALKRISLTTKPMNEEILLHEEKSNMVKAANKSSKQRDENVCQKESVLQNDQSLLSTELVDSRDCEQESKLKKTVPHADDQEEEEGNVENDDDDDEGKAQRVVKRGPGRPGSGGGDSGSSVISVGRSSRKREDVGVPVTHESQNLTGKLRTTQEGLLTTTTTSREVSDETEVEAQHSERAGPDLPVPRKRPGRPKMIRTGKPGRPRKTQVLDPVNLNEELEVSDAGDWVDTVLQKFVEPVPESVITEPDPIPKVI